MTDFEKWYDENYLKLCYTAEENGLVYFQKCDLKTAYEAGAEGYEKQKEINKELVDEITAARYEIGRAQKTALYNLDGWRKSDAELEKAKTRIAELETQIKQMNEREAQDIRARFPC